MSDERRFPEAAPEAHGGRWFTIAEVGQLLGMSERSARDWVKRHQLPTNEARPVRVEELAVREQMARERRTPRRFPEVPGEVSGEVPGGASEPIDAGYRVTPAEIEQAVERTGAKYVADMQTMYRTISEEYRRLYEAQLAAKDETITELRRRAEVVAALYEQRLADKDAALAAKAETIAEIRAQLEQRNASKDVTQDAPDALGGPTAGEPATDAPTPPAGLWGRLRAALLGH